MNCVIYARVSPTKHIKTANDLHQSIEESLKVCRRAASYDKDEIVEEYIDEYVSGKSSKHMPAFQQMMNDARGKKFERIYCRRVNRFGRSRADMLKAEIELSELGITLNFVESGVDTSKKYGKSIMGFMAEEAEDDRIQILENTARGREEYLLNGGKFGQPIKEVNVDALRRDRLLPIGERPTWAECEQRYAIKDSTGTLKPVSKSTLIKRLKEAGYWDYEKRTVK